MLKVSYKQCVNARIGWRKLGWKIRKYEHSYSVRLVHTCSLGLLERHPDTIDAWKHCKENSSKKARITQITSNHYTLVCGFYFLKNISTLNES